ncbi:MAG: hypothetical protein WCG87_13230 [Bacteroidota bacterium]
MNKRLYHIGLLAYLVLLILSVIFYKERTIFTDIAFHLFCIVKDSSLAIQNFRFVAISTQFLPLMARKAEMSLSSIMYIYSASFVLYYAACYVICGSILKRYEYAMIVLLCNVLFVSDTYYWIQSELPQAISIMIVVLAYVHNRSFATANPIALALVFIGIFTASFSHPLLLIPFLYCVTFLLLSKDIHIDSKLLYVVTVFYIGMVIIKNLIFKTPYESAAMNSSGKLINTFPHYFQIYSNKRFLQNCITKYYWMPVIGIAISAHYFITKQWAKMLLFCTFFVAYLLLINVSYPGRDTSNSYIENLYMPLGIIIALPFVFDLLPLLDTKKLAYPAFTIILITGCIRMYGSHSAYTQRLDWERRFLNDNGSKKLLIDFKKVPTDTLMLVWATPYEFWLLSTIENHHSASITISDDPNGIAWGISNSKAFLPAWGSFPYSDLPKQYFPFDDTVSAYTLIK